VEKGKKEGYCFPRARTSSFGSSSYAGGKEGFNETGREVLEGVTPREVSLSKKHLEGRKQPQAELDKAALARKFGKSRTPLNLLLTGGGGKGRVPSREKSSPLSPTKEGWGALLLRPCWKNVKLPGLRACGKWRGFKLLTRSGNSCC